MSRRAVGGYTFHAEIVRARNAAASTREALRRLLDERPGPQTQAMLIARAAIAQGEIESALNEIDEIVRGDPSLRSG